MHIQDAITYLGRIDNMSGQVCQLDTDGKPVLILFDLGCSTCSEVASKNADELGDALVSLTNAVPSLVNACQAALDFYDWHMNAVPSQVLKELIDRRAALQAQLKEALAS